MTDGGASPRRIGIVVSGRHLGSRERLFFAVGEALVERGWTVELLTAGPEPSLRDALPPALGLVDIGPAALRALPVPRLLRLALGVGRLRRWIDDQSPALLFGTSIPPNLAALAAVRRARSHIPVVLRQSNTLRIPGHPRYAGLRRRLRDPWIPRWYPAAHSVIAVADEVADNLRSLGAVRDGGVEVIYNAVGTEQAAALAAEPPEHPWFAPVERDADCPLLVSVGRLVRKKDQLGMLDAFAKLRAKRSARLVIFGEGPMRRALERRILELGLTESVALPGHTENPFAHIARADVFVLSSVSEGMPSVLIEALACGTPVVSTDCPSGPREILRPDGPDSGAALGELVPVGDAAALAGALERILARPAASASIASLERRAADFSFERVVPRYVAVLEGAATSGAAGE